MSAACAFSTSHYRQLVTGINVSVLSLGGSGYGGLYGEYNEREAMRTLHSALDKGINYIDASPFYGEGRSETFLGKALSTVPRHSYHISTKVGCYQWDIKKRFNFTPEKIISGFEESLKRLQLDYVDILQLHDIEFAPSQELLLNESLPTLQKLKDKGLCRAIGITGYPLQPLKDIVIKSDVKIDTVLTYCRLTLNDSSLKEHFNFFKDYNISLINASPVSLGLLTEGGVQWWNPASSDIKRTCSEAVEYCKRHGVDISRLAVNYSTSFNEVMTTLVAISDEGMLTNNISAVIDPLTDKEREIKKEIEERYFSKLTVPHWEGIELKQYLNELKNNNVQWTKDNF